MMDIMKEFKSLLGADIETAWNAFSSEISTDENRDYRRGFKAGLLVGRLQIRADFSELEDIYSQNDDSIGNSGILP